jgi:uncharacterized protein YbaP (TraB family)
MKKIVIALIFVSIIFSSCQSQRSLNEGERPYIHGLLSKIEYNGNTAYFFGSMHLGRENWFPLAGVVEDAMRASSVFVFEFDLTLQHEVAARAAPYLSLPQGVTLQDFLPAHVFDNFITNLATYDYITYDMIAGLTPMGAVTIITAVEIYPFFNLTDEFGVESYLLRFALENGKTVRGLNDIDSEIQLMFNLPHEVQVAVLQYFEDKETALASFRDIALVQAYEAQDIEAILLALRTTLDDRDNAFIRHMEDIMIIKRSIEFANEVERLLRETQTPTVFFITAGIGHFIGDDYGNMFNVLRDRGFTVTDLWNQ